MEKGKLENNRVTLSGHIVSNFEFSHEIFGEGFYTAMLASDRLSGTKDIIPIMVSDGLVDVKADWTGSFAKVLGQFRSYSRHEGERNKLVLYVFVREFEVWEEDGSERATDENEIFLDGYICKNPIYRKTPLGRDIADVLLAVNRPYGKSDYLPVIFWGRNARYVKNMEVGENLKVSGRIQSRKYIKQLNEDKTEERTAYEVSASKVEA